MRFTTPSNVNRHLRALRHSRSPSSSGQDSSSDSASLGEGLSPPLLEDASFADPQTAATRRMPSFTQLTPTSSNLSDWNRGDGPQTITTSSAFTSHPDMLLTSAVGESPDENIPELPTQATWDAYFPPSGPSSSSLPSYQNYTEIQSYVGPGPMSSISHGFAYDVGAPPPIFTAPPVDDHPAMMAHSHNQQERQHRPQEYYAGLPSDPM